MYRTLWAIFLRLCRLVCVTLSSPIPLVIPSAVPLVIPDGYNANLNENEVEFKCLAPAITVTFLVWYIDGSSTAEIAEEKLVERGIRYSTILRVDGDTDYAFIFIDSRTENDNTTIECHAFSRHGFVGSYEILFRVQGV